VKYYGFVSFSWLYCIFFLRLAHRSNPWIGPFLGFGYNMFLLYPKADYSSKMIFCGFIGVMSLTCLIKLVRCFIFNNTTTMAHYICFPAQRSRMRRGLWSQRRVGVIVTILSCFMSCFRIFGPFLNWSVVRLSRLVTVGDRSFADAGPRLWNT